MKAEASLLKLVPASNPSSKLPRKIYSNSVNSKNLLVFYYMLKKRNGQPGALKLLHTQGLGRGPTIWCIVRSLTLFLHKRLFPELKPVTFQSHDNNFTRVVMIPCSN